MDKFMYHIPTKVFFGRGQLAQLSLIHISEPTRP